MKPNQALEKIRELLDALPEKKTHQERLSLIIQVKVFVEIMQKQFKQARDKERASNERRTQIIKKALKELIITLDAIFKKHGEVGDTAVRDKMFCAILDGFIKPQKNYKLPMQFGMFSEEGNILVHATIKKFLTHPEMVAARRVLATDEDRLMAFQDYDVETRAGTNVFEYFGYRNKPVA